MVVNRGEGVLGEDEKGKQFQPHAEKRRLDFRH